MYCWQAQHVRRCFEPIQSPDLLICRGNAKLSNHRNLEHQLAPTVAAWATCFVRTLSVYPFRWNHRQELQETIVNLVFQCFPKWNNHEQPKSVSAVVRVASKRGRSSLPTKAPNRKVAKFRVKSLIYSDLGTIEAPISFVGSRRLRSTPCWTSTWLLGRMMHGPCPRFLGSPSTGTC